MLLKAAVAVHEVDVAAYAWSALRVFRNIEHTTAAITAAHQLGAEHQANVRKQARQIRYCLIQAEEYARAADAVTSATRPTLQYYSMLSLATAELLFKGTGDVSLDRARQQHDHHGLSFSLPPGGNSLPSASELLARPAIFGDSRRGTFELWHSSSRFNPMCGPLVRNLAQGGSVTHSMSLLMASPDVPPPSIPEKGYSLLFCMQHIPGLAAHMGNFAASSLSARCSVGIHQNDSTKVEVTSVNFHPGPADLLARIYDRVSADPPTALTSFDYPSGRSYTFTRSGEEEPTFTMPNGVTIGTTCYVWPYSDEESYLNYFGWLYVASFILGSYARYYPDKWMRDIEETSYLAAAAENFYRIAAEHGPLSTLSELSRNYAVPMR